MGNETDALQLLHEVLSLPEDERTPLLLSDATIAAIEELHRALESDPENGEIRHPLGWWHELVSSVVTAEQARDEHHAQAVALLLPIYLIDPDQVPDRISEGLISLAESEGSFVAQSLPKVLDGTATTGLDEIIDSAEIAAFLTPVDHPERAGRLSNLCGALVHRFERTGDLDDLNNAITIGRDAVENTPTTHLNRAITLSNLCGALVHRFERTGDLDDLNNAITIGREAVENTPTTHPNRGGWLSNLCGALVYRFERTGDLDDLNNAITIGREAVENTPTTHPNRAGRLASLHIALQSRFERTGDLDDLNNAITMHHQAMTATPTTHPNRAGHLASLASALHNRYERTGDLDDLNNAITMHHQAMTATPTTHPNRAGHLASLASALHNRYERTGDLDDLNNAITMHHQAMTATPTTHTKRAVMASNLGIALQSRFERTGDLDDLNNAITMHHQAMTATPTTHTNHGGFLSNLCGALQTRFERTGDLDDLNNAITIGREAVENTPTTDPSRASTLSNLCGALIKQFERSGDLDYVNNAIIAIREAVKNTPVTHPSHIAYLSNLGSALRHRFNRTGDLDDLNNAIIAIREAVDTTPTNHLDRAGRLFNLGSTLRTRFRYAGNPDDLATAIGCYQAAAEDLVAPPRIACEAAADWGRNCTEDEAATAFGVALGLLPRVTPRSLRYEDALAHGGSLSSLGRDAAAAYIASGDPERAVAAVEQAGATTYSRMLHTRTDLSELHKVRPDLAERISKTLAVLNSGTRPLGISPGELALAPEQVAAARRNADAELEEALAEVRQLGGLWTRFFLAPDVDDLIRTAAHGPLVTLVVSERRCDALVTTADGVHLVSLPDLTEDDAYSQANRFLAATRHLSDYRSTSQQEAEAHRDISEVCGWMWDVIVGPVMTHLGHTDPIPGDDYSSWPRIWWIPTGPLAILPIHAAGHHDGGPAVIDRVISSTLPTIRTLLAGRSKPLPEEESRRALLVGMPQTPPMGDQPIFDLPGVAAEVSEVQSRLHATPQLAFVEGRDRSPHPTKQALLEQLPQHAWVHLACHAYSDPGNPTRSVLLLSDHQDDPFTVLDLTSTPSNAGQLLFLSACTTARTGLDNLDEPVHFAAAALLAGYRQVIATLWPLRDDTGAEVADFIYSELTADGRPISWGADDASIAVHRAVQDQRRTPGTPIYTWATFVHFGA